MITLSSILAFVAPVVGLMPNTQPKVKKYKVGTRKDLIQWLETKNPTETYDWNSTDFCLIAQYAADKQIRGYGKKWSVGYFAFIEGMGDHTGSRFVREVAATEPQNFGAALERARAFR